MIGYQEKDGEIESTEQFLKGIESYMKFYGALIQTEVALDAFLQMAGFALFRKYKSQFRKILNIIHSDFLDPLKSSSDPS
ncbi:hypothetical protein NE237_000127 [Protea cynaroides]|uniref:mRNA export factor GLE1 n=1 Tax=Protea cynaroides TaxID=273540 RepID=A0A9Q0GM92_9MAGN|nr:hypothetical protein NE237_000127 [Protea cynaroides]